MRMTDHYTFAPEAQRAWLAGDFRRTPPKMAYEALPVCDEGSPCLDGRCPTCGAALTDTLNSFLFKVCSNEIGPWHHSAFFIETDELSHPELFRTDLAGMAASLRQAASSLAHADFVFLASIGLLHVKNPNRLVIAAEVICRGGAWEEQVIRSTLRSRFGSKCRPLMLVTEDDAAENNFVFLLENLLAPYSSREVDEPTERAPIQDRRMLRSIANVYGPHSIFDRVVSYGIGEGERGIQRVPHRWGSLQKVHPS